MRVLHNYITNEEPKEVATIEDLHTLKLYELREMYPHIKAKSVDSFIHKLNQ